MMQHMTRIAVLAGAALAATGAHADMAPPPAERIAHLVYQLDTDYQLAVKNNHADTMAQILADDFVLVTGKGAAYTKADLLKSARDKDTIYEHQDESQKTVRVYGDAAAVVTALLWIKGVRAGAPIDYKLWYSDTYVKRGGSWQYVFGQASLRLPDAP